MTKLSDETIAKLDATFAERNSGWLPIDSAPKDGTVVELTWMEGSHAQEIWPMQWGHIQKNGLFPDRVGMWIVPDGSITWNDDERGGGPTHWRPYAGWAANMRRRYNLA